MSFINAPMHGKYMIGWLTHRRWLFLLSFQFYNLQVAMLMNILGQIWFNKNKARFDWKYAPAIRAVAKLTLE